jgi:UDP-3-O-[3-hydroxymyristoyl] N-acetylglucosamine deacetylase
LIQPSRDRLFIDYKADFRNPFIGDSSLQMQISQEIFEQSIAPARTFGFLDQLPLLRQYNLARGTSLGNTVVIDGDLLNNMRLPAECVRHKVLDLVGDMALLGVGLAASVVAVKTGHGFNRLIVKHYKEHPEDWERVISSD